MPRLLPLLACAALVCFSAPAPGAEQDALSRAVAGAHRTPDFRSRDHWRHPEETLEFFGLRADMNVIEVYPGGGWYTEILAPFLREEGQLVAAHYGDQSGSEYRTDSHRKFVAKLEAQPSVYDRVEVIAYDPAKGDTLGKPGSADMVLTFRNIHSFIGAGTLDKFLRDAHAVLKKGGVLGVVQHRARAGTDPGAAGKTGYVPQDWLIEKLRSAGFELAASSGINANPADTADHPEGVWTLPPTFRRGEKDRARYETIGESDRMTLRFVKG